MTTPNAPTLRKQANQLEKEAMFAELRCEHATAGAKRAQAKAIRAKVAEIEAPPPRPKPRSRAELCPNGKRHATPRALTLRQLASGFNRSVNRQLNDEPDF